jgi:hypothetical protein
MIQHLLARLDAARLSRRQRDLRRQEQEAIARLGAATLAEGGPREGRLSALATEAAALRRRMAALPSAKRGAKRDPRHEALEAKLHQLHLTAGRLALAMPAAGGGEEVQAIRDELADAASEEARIQADSRRLVEDSWADVQAWLRPRGPLLGAFVVGWWIARSSVIAHTPAVLTLFGRSTKTRGAHWISLAADTTIVQWVLPLLAAAVCAWLGHRAAQRVQASVEEYHERARQRTRSRTGSRSDAPDGADERRRGGTEKPATRRLEKTR